MGAQLAGTFMLFKQRMTLVLADEGVTDPAKQAVKLQITVGNEGLKRIKLINTDGRTVKRSRTII